MENCACGQKKYYYIDDNDILNDEHTDDENTNSDNKKPSKQAQSSKLNNNDNNKDNTSDERLERSAFYFVLRGSLKKHHNTITSLSLTGTYLVSSSLDGSINIWHLDFLLPSFNVQSSSFVSSEMIQVLASIESGHLGDEIYDCKLSNIQSNVTYCIPNALYLLSSGADSHVRCRDVMDILRQQLSRVMQHPAASGNVVEMNDLSNDGSEIGTPHY